MRAMPLSAPTSLFLSHLFGPRINHVRLDACTPPWHLVLPSDNCPRQLQLELPINLCLVALCHVCVTCVFFVGYPSPHSPSIPLAKPVARSQSVLRHGDTLTVVVRTFLFVGLTSCLASLFVRPSYAVFKTFCTPLRSDN